MTNNLTTKPQQTLILGPAIFGNAFDLTIKELGYSITLARIMLEPDLLPEQDRQAVKLFEEKLGTYALAEWQANNDLCRRAITKLTEWRTRRFFKWARLENYQDIKEQGNRMVAEMEPNSATRSIAAFYNKHLKSLEQANVDLEKVTELQVRPDKFSIVTGRAISRITSSEIAPDEKEQKLNELIDDAITFEYASDISKKWINGKIEIPRDEFYAQDGTLLITFVCSTDDQSHEIRKRTESVSVQYGNTQPIILEFQNERTINKILIELKCALAIIQSGDLSNLSTSRQDLLKILEEYGYVSLSS